MKSSPNILVHSFHRTGSTMLTYTLQKAYRAILHGEAFNDADRTSLIGDKDHEINLKLFESYSKNNDPFIIKLMHWNFCQLNKDQRKKLLHILDEYNFHIIRLERKDVKEVIYSNYIARLTNEFQNQSKDPVVADKKQFSDVFNRAIKEYYWFIRNDPYIPYKQKIIYEDFIKNPKIKIGDKECVFNGFMKRSPPKKEKVLNYNEMESWYDELYSNYVKESKENGKLYI